MEKVQWLTRGHFPTYVGFCPSAKAWRREMRRLDALDEPYPDTDAKCTRFQVPGKTVVLITMAERLDEKDALGRVGLLVHEVVHAWQYVCEDMGQRDRAGKEIEAYAIQTLTLDLLAAYSRTRLTSSASTEEVGASAA